MEKYKVPNLERALKILELLAQEGSLSATEISDKLDFPSTSVYRILKTMEANEYLIEFEKQYKISPKLLSIGYAGIESTNLINNSLKEMYSLREKINESIFLGTISGNKVVIIEELPSFQYVKFTVEIGHMAPIHASAPGKAILSFLPSQEQKKLLDHISFTRYTDFTIPSKNAMLKEIETIRNRGYAIDRGEEAEELVCVASPIFNYKGYPIASIWISGPKYRLNEENLDKMGSIVAEHSFQISKKFGFNINLHKDIISKHSL